MKKKITKKVNARFHSELVKIRGFMFYGQSLYKIWDNKLNRWRLGAYTTEEVAELYVDKLNFRDIMKVI